MTTTPRSSFLISNFKWLRTPATKVASLTTHMNLATLRGQTRSATRKHCLKLDEKLAIDENRKSERGKAFDQMNRGTLPLATGTL